MVASPTANRDSVTVTTPSEREIRLTRLFDAPRRLVFEAMTTPEHVKQHRLEDLVAELQRS